ncbi:baculoviral IAP repeat-containing protein 7-A [Trichonephila inaurata madagascariensis]|uniref:Baculoviral IAP repeat-containing protein 7-A n=1 Tax=Trichonephila inaurata madagascariensis TaxID=2747483 RepID=A0A8X6XCC6_9ARAC|nr:baculoviral IAP repeat-containing protein 7-A [Trichonephila inaurata madagascariensis]
MINSKLLAECGFYYTGVLDIVTCFSCNGSLGHWETNDDPFIEHEKFFPYCEYMNFIKMNPKNKVESIEDKVLREACKIFSTLKVQRVAVENLRNTGQHFKSLNDVCEAVLKYDNKALPPVPKNEKGNMDTVHETVLEYENKVLPPVTKNEKGNKDTMHEAVLEYENKVLPLVTKNEKGNMDTVICKICIDKEMDAVFQPCSHLVSCHICAANIFDCPLCRNPVTHKIKVFRG